MKKNSIEYSHAKDKFTQLSDSTKHDRLTALELYLHSALDLQELSMVYQPIYNMISKKITGIEALVRWQNSKMGLVSSSEFIPIAERIGLIIPIGQWIIKTTLEQYDKWYKSGNKDILYSTNISPKQLILGDLTQFITKTINKLQLPPNNICLELTETTTVFEYEIANNVVFKLHENGISFAIDDFGTGYSSLIQLKHLPISTIKIDRTFVKYIGKNRKDEIIIKSIIDLAKNLKLNTVAEGIENKKQYGFLFENGCTHAQGDYLSSPLTAEEMIKTLEED